MNSSNLWRGAVLAVIVSMALGGSACGGRRARALDARAARYQGALVQQAARDTGCQPGQLSPGQIGPDVYTVTGCTVPIEYMLQCGGRGRRCSWVRVATLNEAAAPYLQCQPQMIQQQPTQAPNVRYATGCGQQASFTIQCDGRGCGWMMSGPPQGQAPQVAVQVQQPQGPLVVEPGAPAAQGEVAAVQSQLQTQREAIMSCIDVGSINLTVRWTAQGVVQIALPPELAGTAAEGCIQAAVGTLRVVTQQAGQVVIPVQ